MIKLRAEDFILLHERRCSVVDTVRRITRCDEAAEDSVSHAFMTALRCRKKFRGECDPLTWIKTIAIRHALMGLRRSRRWSSLDLLLALGHTWSETTVTHETHPRLAPALQRLSPKYRNLIVGHYVEDRSMSELARRHRIPLGTVLSRMHKARRHLRASFNFENTKARIQ